MRSRLEQPLKPTGAIYSRLDDLFAGHVRKDRLINLATVERMRLPGGLHYRDECNLNRGTPRQK